MEIVPQKTGLVVAQPGSGMNAKDANSRFNFTEMVNFDSKTGSKIPNEIQATDANLIGSGKEASNSTASSKEFIAQRIDINLQREQNQKGAVPSYLRMTDNSQNADDAFKVIDLTVGPNEKLGNDVVLLKFDDGSLRVTQKALYEAAVELGAFHTIKSGGDFADWHLNTWSSGVMSDPDYIKAHESFNSSQVKYDEQLRLENPEIFENRLNFVKQYASDNKEAIAAAVKDVELHLPTKAVVMKFENSIETTFLETGEFSNDTSPLPDPMYSVDFTNLVEDGKLFEVDVDITDFLSDNLTTVQSAGTFNSLLEHTSPQNDDE